MKRSTSPHSAAPAPRDPGLRLLRRVARAADAIARRLRRTRTNHDSDLRIWALAEKEILGPRAP